MSMKNEVVSPTVDVLKEAETCRLQAQALIKEKPNQFSDLAGKPSGWCVVTKKGFFGASFHVHREAGLLQEAVKKGGNVLLTVGIVANPAIPLNANNHAAVVKVSESCKLDELKLSLLTSQAKLKAVYALAH